jgi:hypothetical protein
MAADNTELPPGVGGDTVRDLARQGGTAKTQVVQLDLGGATLNAEKLITAGQQVMADSVPVTMAVNQPAFPVTGTFWQATQPVSGTFFPANQPISALALPLPTGAATETTLAALNAKVTAVNTGATTISTPLPAGTNALGSITNTTFAATQATPSNLQMTATPIALAKGTQGATGFAVQNLKDAGRNQTNYFMAGVIAATAVEALQSLTGYKGGVAVAATTTPAVVTAAKIYRINRIVITYIGLATAALIQVNLRANTGGVVALTSPIVDSWVVGEAESATASIAGGAQTIVINFPDGLEFPAGTGVGITVLGLSAIGVAAAAGFAKVSLGGYEY